MKRIIILILVLSASLKICAQEKNGEIPVINTSVRPQPAEYSRGEMIDPFRDLEHRKEVLWLNYMIDSVASYMKPIAEIRVRVGVDSLTLSEGVMGVHLSKSLSDYYFRDSSVNRLYSIVDWFLPSRYDDYSLQLHANGSKLEDLKSIFYSQKDLGSVKRGKLSKNSEPVLVENLSRPYEIKYGLDGKHLAVWQSHGFYYEQKLQRWEWQRARLFQTVEDLFTQSYVLPFMVPMLENAGANTLMPRERDTQTSEVIVDNDSQQGYAEMTDGWQNGYTLGFANLKDYYVFGENPFRMGTFRELNSKYSKRPNSENYVVSWLPDIPRMGEYAVYISYHSVPQSTKGAIYTVKYNGGETTFKVNQSMGGGTWIYLGTFPFVRGASEQGVYLSGETAKKNEVITADAVKFGGGMGNMARSVSEQGATNNVKSSATAQQNIQLFDFDVKEEISGYPRYTEGARYWLQWAGYADSVYSYTNNMNDYNDDYVSRGRWVNTISGGSSKNPDYKGLKIPIDMAFAFHSDAGTFLTDSIVGTLGIYTRFSNDSDKYPTGESRMYGRELTDIIQTEIVNDVKSLYEPKWSRRGLWDRSYAEARTPNVPTMLLELLSHQNFADMKYGLDPNFRFTVSRSIYKGIVKYFSLFNGGKYVIQPLPVENMATEFVSGEKGGLGVKLSWSAVNDPLEPSAKPTGYVVYTRKGNGGFDNGVVVKDTSLVMTILDGEIYGFKVAALNDGGISFPSEILSVGVPKGVDPLSSNGKERTVFIMNGFERISAPASFESKDSLYGGFYNRRDAGVPYMKEYAFTGEQYELRRSIPWMSDDATGFGASYTNYEDKVIAGNTFDYPYVHGAAFLKRGYAFVSASKGAVESGKIEINSFPMVDMIMGEQAKTKMGRGVMPIEYEVYGDALMRVITEYCNNGGNILISGAHVGSDVWDSYEVTKEAQEFATNVLKYSFVTQYTTLDGVVRSVSNPFGFDGEFKFSTKPNEMVYNVESPDSIDPIAGESFTIFRYPENNISAGVAYKGEYKSVVLAFPIETLKGKGEIDEMMGEIIDFFTK